ncbi:MAG: helix-turn-helix domain-containing protein [Candidatus Bathyarchaeia archaeon]
MADKRAQAILKSLGLTEYEARAYLALVAHRHLTAGELSAGAAIPLTRVYGVLDSLSEKGFVKMSPGRPRTYEATPPESALSSFLQHLRASAERDFRRLKEVGDELLQELEPRYWEKRYKVSPEELLRALPSLAAAEEETSRAIAEAERRVDILSAVFGWGVRVGGEVAQALARGVAFRLLLLSPEADHRAMVDRFPSSRFEVRAGSEFWYPLRGTIVDKRKVVFVIWASTDKETFWNPIVHRPHLSSHPGVVRAFSALFEEMWVGASGRGRAG